MCITLALAIGLTTAILSLADSILLRALPYPDPGRLTALWTTSAAAARANVSRFNMGAADWTDLRSQSKVFEDIALTRVVSNFNLTGDSSPEVVQGGRISWNLPQVLRVRPVMGRNFTEDETRANAKVAIVSYGFWQQHFASAPDILGRRLQLNSEWFEVVGVMPPEFQYPAKESAVWTPLFVSTDELRARWGFNYRAVGRLKPGITIQQAQAEVSRIMQGLARQYPTTNADLGLIVESLLDSAVGQFKRTLYTLLAAVSSLLLIGCINLSGLLILRTSIRTHEFAIRAALGASAARLRRQALAEVLSLSAVGSIGGILLAWGLLKLLIRWLPPRLAGIDSVGLHGPALVFAVMLSVLVVLIAGILPAQMVARAQLASTMQQDSRTVVGGAKTRNGFVAVQIAITLVLVFAGGLLARSFIAVMKVNPGFSTQGVLTMQLAVTKAKYPTDRQISDYYHRLITRMRAVAGVVDVGFVNLLPFSEGRLSGPVYFEGKLDGGWIGADSRSATPGYFSAMRIPLVQGRNFNEDDSDNAPRVCLIDAQLARLVFSNESPLGKRLRFGLVTPTTPWVEIMGVVGHVRNESLESDPRPQVYWPEAQRPDDRGALVIRTDVNPASLILPLVEQIHSENQEQAVYDVRSMKDRLDSSLQSRNLLTGLVMLFGGSSLLLACLGLYGVVSYGVELRLREFAIRAALGAQPWAVRRLVLAHAVRLWILGSAIGLIAAWPVGWALQNVLYGVGTTDAVALAISPILLFVTSLAAGLGPALKAGRTDPMVTLRGD